MEKDEVDKIIAEKLENELQEEENEKLLREKKI